MGLSDASAMGLLHGASSVDGTTETDSGSEEASRLRGELAKARRKIEALERAVRRQATAQAEREQRLVNLRDVAVEELRREIARLAAEKPTERSEPASALSIEEQLARSIMRQRSAPRLIAPAVIAEEPPAPRSGAFQRALQDIDALDRLVRDLQFKRARAQIKEDEATRPAQDREERRRAEIEIIRTSGLFDAERYVKKVPGVADPIARYVQGGLDEDVAPHPIFANRWYVSRHAKHLAGWLTPFAHFLEAGWRKSLDPHPLFKTRWYLAQNEDVKMSGINPFVHFMTRGHREGRNPNPYFDTAWYRETYLFDSQPDANPLIHYFLSGRNGAYEPSPDFDTARLSEHYPRVGLGQTNPLAFLLGLEDVEQEQALARMRAPVR